MIILIEKIIKFYQNIILKTKKWGLWYTAKLTNKRHHISGEDIEGNKEVKYKTHLTNIWKCLFCNKI